MLYNVHYWDLIRKNQAYQYNKDHNNSRKRLKKK